ncbi:MAG: tetratricopeptide repeat protein [Planctomycetaceae bacterium]
MKSEERHRLKTNELQRLGSQLSQSLGPIWTSYGKVASLVAGALVLVILLTNWWMASSEAESAAEWGELFTAKDAGGLANVFEDHPNSLVGDWAKLSEAKMHLSLGTNYLLAGAIPGQKNRLPHDELQEARKCFEELLEKLSKTDPLHRPIHEQALFGLAQCIETLSSGDTSEAVAAYEQLTHDYPETVYLEVAEQRIETLKKTPTQEFYAWFANRPVVASGPPSFPSDQGASNANSSNLFEIPFLPEIPDMLKLEDQPLATDASPLESPDEPAERDQAEPPPKPGDPPAASSKPVEPGPKSQ